MLNHVCGNFCMTKQNEMEICNKLEEDEEESIWCVIILQNNT